MGHAAKGAFGILERDGSMLLVANWRNFAGRRVLCWDLPGGGVEAGETLQEACAREFREETGLLVEVEDLAFMVERMGFRGAPPDEAAHFFVFHVRQLEELGAELDADIVDQGWWKPEELPALCREPYQREVLAWLAGGRRQRYFLTVPRSKPPHSSVGR